MNTVNKTYHIDNIPSQRFDWEKSVELACESEDVAKEMAKMLQAKLKQFHQDVLETYQTNDIQALGRHVHKIHGGLCYLSAPQLHYLSYHLEAACQNNDSKIISEIMQIYPSCILDLHEDLSSL